MRDVVRLAVGTLTVLPVRPPARVDRRTGGRAMLLAPAVGLLLALPVAGGTWLLEEVAPRTAPLLVAALGLTALAVLTRGLHLDGLADTADGLGSGAGADRAQEIMRRGDVGPFGVVTLVLALLLQVTALAACLERGSGPGSLVVALVVSRLALPVVCGPDLPAARPDGLGSTVAGTVGRGVLPLAAVPALVAVLLVAGLPGLVGAGLLPLALAWALAHRCRRRLGGMSGDVLGACVEVAFTASVLVAAFL